MLADPEKWEAAWNRDLKLLWEDKIDGLAHPLASFANSYTQEEVVQHASEEALFDLQRYIATVCTGQNQLANDLAMKSVYDDFEKRWKGATEKERHNAVLTGICRAMEAGTRNLPRMLCPESTLENLTTENGETYLKYLRMSTPDDFHKPLEEPKRIRNRYVERYLSIRPHFAGHPGYKSLATLLEYRRIECINEILRETFFAFVSFLLGYCSIHSRVSDLPQVRRCAEENYTT